MNYILLAFFSSILYGVYEFIKKITLKKSSVYEILFLYTFIGLILSSYFLKEAINTPLLGISLVFLKSAIISAVWMLNLKALEKLNVSVAAPFSLLATVFVTIFAFLFYGEPISLKILIGMIIVLLGLIVISKIGSEETKKENDYRYIWLLVIGSFLASFTSIIDKLILSNNYATSGSMLFYFMLFLTIIYGVFYFVHNKKIEFKKLKTNYLIIFIGVGTVFSDLFYYASVAAENSNLGMISLIKRLAIFLTISLAAFFLKEKNVFKKIIILSIMFIGLGLIIFI